MNKYSKFLFSMTKIGCIGFGGGSALIPVIEEEIIDEQKIDTKENLDKDVVVASITPGALPIEIATSLGKRNFGNKGMVMGALAMATPGAVITVLLLTLLSTVQSEFLNIVELASVGVSVFIIYILISYIRNVLAECRKESEERARKAVFLMLGSFLIVCGKNLFSLLGIELLPILSLSTFHVLLLAFFCILYLGSNYSIKDIAVIVIIGGIFVLSHGKSQIINNVYIVHTIEIVMVILAIWGIYKDIRENGWEYHGEGKKIGKDLVFWIVFLIVLSMPAILSDSAIYKFLGDGILSAILSFGGGDAYLTIADGLFVDSGMITDSQYYSQIVPVVNILPGSILCKTLSGVGYYVGLNISGSIFVGIFFAIAGFACSVASSCGFFMAIYHLYSNLSSLRIIRMIGRWIRPIIAGFLLNIMLSLCSQSVKAAAQFGVSKIVTLIGIVLMLLLDVLLKNKMKLGNAALLVINLIIVFAVIFVK